jgi:hypothetical protein
MSALSASTSGAARSFSREKEGSGKQFGVIRLRQQLAGSGSGSGTATRAPSRNIYIGPNTGFTDSLVRFVVEFVGEGGSPAEDGDKMVEIRASGGQHVWSQQFPLGLPGLSLATKKQTRVVSARLWHDQTFEYSIFAGVEFVSPRQGEPTRTFYSKTLTFKMPRRGTIRLRLVLAEKQHQSGFLPAVPQSAPAALAAFQARYPKLGVGGINDAMRNSIVIPTRNPSTNQVNYSFFYYTGGMKLEVAR